MTTHNAAQQTAQATEQALREAVNQHHAGNLEEAETCFRAILQLNPNHPEANYYMGVLAMQRKQAAASLPYFTLALDADPARGYYWLSYIEALFQSGQVENARQILALARQQGLEGSEVDALVVRLDGGARGASQPDAERLHSREESRTGSSAITEDGKKISKPIQTAKKSVMHHGKNPTVREINELVALFNQGRLTEAATLAQEMTVRFPQHWIGWKMLGVVFQQLGRDADALLPMRKTVSLAPGDAEAHNNLGVILQNMGRLEEAEASYRSALKINPGYAHAHGNLGATLQALRRLDEAESSYRRAIKIKPDYAKAHCNLGSILQEFGRMDEAEASYLRALQINANDADAHYFLGNMLRGQGRSQEAEKCYRQALKINPDYADAHWALGYILHVSGRLIEAETSYRRALQIKPDHVEVCSNLGVLLQDTGRLDEAETILRRVLQLNPNYAEAFSNLLFGLAQTTTEDVKSLFFEHCRFGDRFEAAYREKFSSHGNSRDPERCLQIGFVSGDLCDHAVAYFIEPVLSPLSGYSSLSLHAYSNSAMEDEVTQRMRGYFAHWNQIAGLSDVSLDEKIRADRIDILIDLSGHTARNRLLAFARKPAPLQLSWIGYPGTTGLKAMDYFLADSHFLPPGLLDDQFTEKIVRLPATAPFLPYREAPTVNSLPALRNGYVTFGTFNRLSKINRSTVALWTQLLRALPDSRMVLGGMPRDGNYDNLIAWFEQEGIARERLDGHTRGGMDAYLSLHQQVDICLDTFPYNGGTTTSHALWMGVPTLTLLGSTVPSRVGAMLLGYVGLKDFIALDNDDFVRKGQLWAGNLPELAGIRAGLRERFSESALGRPDLIAAGLERALRIMWQRWCAGMPTESFEVPQNEISDATQEADV